LFNFYQANNKFKSQKYPKAIEYYKQCLELINESPNKLSKKAISTIYFYFGLSYFHIKDFKSAVEQFDNSIKNNKAFWKAYYRRGCAYEQLKNI